MINETKQFLQKSVKTSFFIQKSVKKHGNKFDYSKVNYINSTTKVCIICTEHGDFEQTPASHLSGKGCPNCKHRNQSTEDVIKRCIKIHGSNFDYSKVVYINMKNKVEIKCNICKTSFMQSLDKHINSKQGCPTCQESKGENLIRQ